MAKSSHIVVAVKLSEMLVTIEITVATVKVT